MWQEWNLFFSFNWIMSSYFVGVSSFVNYYFILIIWKIFPVPPSTGSSIRTKHNIHILFLIFFMYLHFIKLKFWLFILENSNFKFPECITYFLKNISEKRKIFAFLYQIFFFEFFRNYLYVRKKLKSWLLFFKNFEDFSNYFSFQSFQL